MQSSLSLFIIPHVQTYLFSPIETVCTLSYVTLVLFYTSIIIYQINLLMPLSYFIPFLSYTQLQIHSHIFFYMFFLLIVLFRFLVMILKKLYSKIIFSFLHTGIYLFHFFLTLTTFSVVHRNYSTTFKASVFNFLLLHKLV